MEAQADTSSPRYSRTTIWFGVVLGIVGAILSPSIAAASVLGLIGFACARSAWVDRQTGWVYGLVLGLALMVFVIGGAGVFVFYAFFR